MTLTPADAALFVGLAIASYTDVREGKIYNALTFPLMAIGLVLHGAQGAPLFGVVGLAVAAAIHYPLFVFHVERGGDAKLMMAIGALLGWSEVVEATLWKFLIHIPVGLIVLALRGRLGNLAVVARALGRKAAGTGGGEEPETTPMIFALVITGGTLLARFTDLLRLW